MTVSLNHPVPDFSAKAQTASGEQTVTLSSYAGKKLVVYFYPKDSTPGCTTEGNEFNDNLDVFRAENCEIVGVSKDSLRKHTNFIAKQGFDFPLIADEDEQVCKIFDVIKLKKNFGKEYLGIERSTFLIDEKGVLTHEWRKVKVKDHVSTVLATVKGEAE